MPKSDKLPTYEEVCIKLWNSVQEIMDDTDGASVRHVNAVPPMIRVLIECIERAKVANATTGIQEMSDEELGNLLAKAKVIKLEPRDRNTKQAG